MRHTIQDALLQIFVSPLKSFVPAGDGSLLEYCCSRHSRYGLGLITSKAGHTGNTIVWNDNAVVSDLLS